MPSSFWAKRPLLAPSAYIARKEYRARECLNSGMCGAVLRRVVSTSRSVASFLQNHASAVHVHTETRCTR